MLVSVLRTFHLCVCPPAISSTLFRGSIENSTEGPSDKVHMLLPAHRMSMSTHPSHVTRPYRELQRRPQWQSSHAAPSPPHVHFGAPPKHFVAPQGAPPMAEVPGP
eukprot:5692605-Pyramimonas_sp.AAC.1